jgi:autotransporter-associated beta strand protein
VFAGLRGFVIAAALALPTAAFAQVQANQNFVTQGPSPSFGPLFTVQSGDANGTHGSVAGAAGPVVADPLDTNTLFVGTPAGGIWKTTDGGATWKALTDKQATLSISSLAYDPTDPNRNTLIAGTGLTANGSVNYGGLTGSGGLRNGLLYSQDGGKTWTSLGAATLANQSVVGVAARGNVLLAGTYELSGFATDRHIGALYRSTDGGANFQPISGTAGLPNGPISSIAGDPTNPNRLYAAVTAPNASGAGKASTALFVSNDTGAHWTQVFGAAQSGGTIQSTTQTIIKVATGSEGAVAVAVVDYVPGTHGQVTGLFWSGNSGTNWTQLPTPALSDGVKQASVNSAIAIDPKNKNLVYVAGDGIPTQPFTLPAFRIDASAGTFNSITDANTADGSTVHSDSRGIAFDANGRLIVTSDGTIYARTNPHNDSGVWTRISGNISAFNISAFEVYSVAYDAVGKRLAAAGQDNGVTIQSGRNAPLWNAVLGADGVNVFVNDVTLAGSGRSVFYANTQGDGTKGLGDPIRIIRHAQGNFGSPNTAEATVTCDGTECQDRVVGSWFGSPWVNNRIDPTRMALAGSRVYVTQDTLTGAQDPAATTVDLRLTDLGPTGDGGQAGKIAYGTRDNPNMIVVGSFGLSQSTTAAENSLVPVPAYAAAGGLSPTGIALDPRSHHRYFVADNTNLFGTMNRGGLFTNLTANLMPLGIIRPTALEFISHNGVDALLTGGLNNVANAQSTIAIADSDEAGALSNWRPFGTGLPNAQVNALSYNPAADVLAVGTFGRGVFTLYDVTSYFPQATVLQFGLADNDSQPDASFLTDGTRLNGTGFSRPLNKYGTGTLTIAGDATYTGGTSIFGGALQLGTGGTSGSILGNVAFCSDASNSLCDPSTNKMLVFNRSDTYSFDGAISGPGQVVQFGTGKTVLTAVNTYTGPTYVNGGTLSVNGSIASSPVFVNFGGTLGGNGTVGPTTLLAGGTLSPGNSVGTLTVNGNLVFAAASLYMVEVEGNNADRTNASGTATLAGTVGVSHLGGKLARSYTILSAAAGRTGTFDSLVPINLPAFITASLAYTPTDVQLNLESRIRQIAGLTRNHAAVAAALDRAFDRGGSLFHLHGLAPSQIPAALDMLSGEGVSGTRRRRHVHLDHDGSGRVLA